jgi:hypothetical protein
LEKAFDVDQKMTVSSTLLNVYSALVMSAEKKKALQAKIQKNKIK